jgi:hypothetical protein
MKKGHLVFNESKSWYLIQMGRILTIGQKSSSQVVKLGGKGWLGQLFGDGVATIIEATNQQESY